MGTGLQRSLHYRDNSCFYCTPNHLSHIKKNKVTEIIISNLNVILEDLQSCKEIVGKPDKIHYNYPHAYRWNKIKK